MIANSTSLLDHGTNLTAMNVSQKLYKNVGVNYNVDTSQTPIPAHDYFLILIV